MRISRLRAILIQLGVLPFFLATAAYADDPPVIDPLGAPPGAVPAVVDESRPHALDFPADAARGREEGKVILLLTIDATGAVVAASVRQTSVNDDLDSAAIASVSTWHFLPATVDGHPVVSRRYLTVTYEMR